MKNVKEIIMGVALFIFLQLNLTSCHKENYQLDISQAVIDMANKDSVVNKKDSIVKKDSVVTTIVNTLVYPNDNTFLKTFIKGNPRLVLTKEKLNYLKTQYTIDPILRSYIDKVITQANSNLNGHLPVFDRNTLLNEANYSLDIVTNLSFAYLWTGNAKYADKAKTILNTVCAFSDWNPDHFLDTSEMAYAVSFGLDWLYNYLDDATRKVYIQALVNKCLEPAKLGYSSNTYWSYTNSNWNIICNSGIITASLAVAEWHREYADLLIPKAIKALDIALKEFAPDGAWPEGPGYQRACLEFYSYAVSSLLSSTGNDLNLVKNYPYMNAAGTCYTMYEGRSKYFLCYADITGKYKRQSSPCLFFIGNTFNNADLTSNEGKFLETNAASTFHVLWYNKINSTMYKCTDKYAGGTVPMFVYNNDLYGNNSIYLGLKGGENGSSHGHLDLGNFEFDALGERWARDLGYDNYDLPGYFDYQTATGKRYTYYRVSSFSHNVPIINNSNQEITGKAEFIAHPLQTESPFSVIDLTSAYVTYANKLTRGIRLIDSKRSILIQDEYSLKTSQECYWGITTDATISIIDATNAQLTLNGKVLFAKILSPNCTFSVVSAKQSAPQDPNTGVSRLIAKKAKDSNLNFSIIVLLSPNWSGYHTTTATITPLNQWK